MPANNTNTRNVIYVGDDPEERKYINHWDSVVFDYYFEGDDPYKEDEADCKFLKPSCGIGYCIYRNVKDVYVKVPVTPYDGDTFAIMDITSINDPYIREAYWSKRQLIKETPLSDDIDITLTTAVIYIDNTYDFPCNTKVIYNGVTYRAGEIFQLENTCEFIHQFIYDKGINAWVVVKIDKECPANVDIEVRYWEFRIPRRETSMEPYYYHDEQYNWQALWYNYNNYQESINGINEYGSKTRDKKWNYLPFYWKTIYNAAYTYIKVDYANDYKLRLKGDSYTSYQYVWDDESQEYIYAPITYYYEAEGHDLKYLYSEHFKASKGSKFNFGFIPVFHNFDNANDQLNARISYDSYEFYNDWCMYFTIYNMVDGDTVPNDNIFPNIFSFVEKTVSPEMILDYNDIALFSACISLDVLPWKKKYSFHVDGPLGLENTGILNDQTRLGNYLYRPIFENVLRENYWQNIELSDLNHLNQHVLDLTDLKTGQGWIDGERHESLRTNIIPNFYGEKWQEILKLTGMIYLNYGAENYESKMHIVKYLCNELKTRQFFDYIYTCPPWAIGNGETGDHVDLSALTPIKGKNVKYSRSEYIRHMNEAILIDIDKKEEWFKLPFYFNVNFSPNVDKIYGKIIESIEGISSNKKKYSYKDFSMDYYLITEALHFWELWGYIAGKEKIIPSPTDVQQYIFWDDPRDTFYERNWGFSKLWPSVKHTFEKLYGDERDWGFYYRTTELREAEIKSSFYYLQDVFQEKRFPITYRVTMPVSSYTKWKGLPNERTWRSDTNASTLNNPTIIKKYKTYNTEEDVSDNFFYQRWQVEVPFEIINKYSTLYDREWVLGVQSGNNEYDFYDNFDMLNSLSPSEHASNLSFIMKTWNKAVNTKNIENILWMNNNDVYFVFDTRGDMEFFRWFRMDLLTTRESSYGIYESEKEYLYPSALLHQYGDTYILDSWSQDYIYDIFLHDIGDPSGKLFQFSKTYRTDLKNTKTYPNSTGNNGIEQLYPTEGPHDWLDDWNTQPYYSAGSRSEFVKLSNFNALVDLYPERITDKDKFIEWIKNTDTNKWRLYQRKGGSSDYYKKTLYTEVKTNKTAFYIVLYPDGTTASYTNDYTANNAVYAYNRYLGATDPKAELVTLLRDTWTATSRDSKNYPNNLLKLFWNLAQYARFQFKDEYLVKGDNADSYIASNIDDYIKILNKNDSGVKTRKELLKKLHKAEDWSDDLFNSYNGESFLFKQEWAFMLKDIYPDFAMDHGVYTAAVKMRFSTPDFFLFMHIHYISFGIYKIPLKVEFSEFSYPSIQIKYDDLQINQDRPNHLTQDYREGYSLFPPQVYTTYTFKENWWNYNEDALLRDEFKPYVLQYGEEIVKSLIARSPNLQPATPDDDFVYSAVFSQPIPTTNDRINAILQLFNTLEDNYSDEVVAYTLSPSDSRYYVMYERARYNDGVWNYYDYTTSNVFERKWVSTDVTKYPPTEYLKEFSVEFPDYKYTEYQKEILDKYLPRVRTKNPLDWIFIKRNGVKHYFRQFSANYNSNGSFYMEISDMHKMYEFLPVADPIPKEKMLEYYQNTSDPTPILDDNFATITYSLSNDQSVFYNKNNYNWKKDFILRTFDMKRLYSIGNYRPIPISTSSYTERYINSAGQYVSKRQFSLCFAEMAAAMYFICAFNEETLSPQHNLYEMYASGAYNACLPSSDYSFGNYLEHSRKKNDNAAAIEFILTEPAIQSAHAYYTLDVIFYLNASYRYDDERVPIEIYRKRFYYTKGEHDYRKSSDAFSYYMAKQYKNNDLIDLVKELNTNIFRVSTDDLGVVVGSEKYFRKINAMSDYTMLEYETHLMDETEYSASTKSNIYGYRITWRKTMMNGSYSDSSFTVYSTSTADIGPFYFRPDSVIESHDEMWGSGYKHFNEDIAKNLASYNRRDPSNSQELDRRIIKIEVFDYFEYKDFITAGQSENDAILSSTKILLNIPNKSSVFSGSVHLNDDKKGYGTITCKYDPRDISPKLMFYWKQDKPVRSKCVMFYKESSYKYPAIADNVSYHTTLNVDIYEFSNSTAISELKSISYNFERSTNESAYNKAFSPINVDKGGIPIRFQNINEMKWTLDKISPILYDNLVQEFTTRKAEQNARLAEINEIIRTDDLAIKNTGQGVLTTAERTAFLEEKSKVQESLKTTETDFYKDNCYLFIDIQVSTPFISGQTNAKYAPDKGAIRMVFEMASKYESQNTEGLFKCTILDIDNIDWNIFFEGQQYNIWDVPRLVKCALITSVDKRTNETLYTAFPYEYIHGTVDFEEPVLNKSKALKEFIENNVELCDVDFDRIPHGIICTRSKDTDVFMGIDGNTKIRYSSTYLQTRKPAVKGAYDTRDKTKLQSFASLSTEYAVQQLGYGDLYIHKYGEYSEGISKAETTEIGDVFFGSDKDINGSIQGRGEDTAFQLKGGDDFWYKFNPANAISGKNPGTEFLGNDYIDAGYGNDVLVTSIGVNSHDTLIGNKGDDTIIGRGAAKGSRTYIINKGDGHDIIYRAGKNDVIKFGIDISVNDVFFSTNKYDEKVLTIVDKSQTVTLVDCFYPIILKFSDGFEKKIYEDTKDDIISMNHKSPDCFDLYFGNFIISKRFNLPNQGYKIVNDMYQDNVGMLFNVHDTIIQTLTYPALVLEFNKMVKQIAGPDEEHYQVISRYVDSCGPHLYQNEEIYARLAEKTLDFKRRTYIGNNIWKFPIIDKEMMVPEDWDPSYTEKPEDIFNRIKPHSREMYQEIKDKNKTYENYKKSIIATLQKGKESSLKYKSLDVTKYSDELDVQLQNKNKENNILSDSLEFFPEAQPSVFITGTDNLYPSGSIIFYNDYELDSATNISRIKFKRPKSVTGRVKCNIYIAAATSKTVSHGIKRQNISFYLDQNDLQRILGWKDTKGTDGPHYEPDYKLDFRFYAINNLLNSVRGYRGNFSDDSVDATNVRVNKTSVWNFILRDTSLFYTTLDYKPYDGASYTNRNPYYTYFSFNEELNKILTDEMKELYNDDDHLHCREEWSQFLAAIQLLNQRVLQIEDIMDSGQTHPSTGLWEDLIYDHVKDNILPIFKVLNDLCEYLAVYAPVPEMVATDKSEDERMPRWLDVALEKGAIDLFEHAYIYNLLAKTFHPYRHFYYDIVVEPISYEYGNVTTSHIKEGHALEFLKEWYKGTMQDEVIQNNEYVDASAHGDDWRWKCDLDSIPLNNPGDEEHKLVIRTKENIDNDNDGVYRTYLLQNSYNEWHFPTDYDLFETLRKRKYYGSYGTEEYFQEEDPVTLPEEYRRETEIFGDRYYTMEEKNKNFIEITPEKWYDTKAFVYWKNNGEQTGYEFWFKEPKFMDKRNDTKQVLVDFETDSTGWPTKPIYETRPKYVLENGQPISEDGVTVREMSDAADEGGMAMYEKDKSTKVTDTFTVKGDKTIINIVRVNMSQSYNPYDEPPPEERIWR